LRGIPEISAFGGDRRLQISDCRLQSWDLILLCLGVAGPRAQYGGRQGKLGCCG
jgi:hypothetical protein